MSPDDSPQTRARRHDHPARQHCNRSGRRPSTRRSRVRQRVEHASHYGPGPYASAGTRAGPYTSAGTQARITRLHTRRSLRCTGQSIRLQLLRRNASVFAACRYLHLHHMHPFLRERSRLRCQMRRRDVQPIRRSPRCLLPSRRRISASLRARQSSAVGDHSEHAQYEHIEQHIITLARLGTQWGDRLRVS
jgi:hypothetical protein